MDVDDATRALFWSQVSRLGRTLDDARIEAGGTLDASLREQMARLGVFAASIPVEHGGLGMGLADTARLVAMLAESDRSVATTVGLHAGLGSQAIVRFADGDLRARLLPEMASGQLIGSFAATEAGAGSDLMGVQTTVRLRDGKLHLDGEKAYVTNGAFAGVYTVLARAPDLGGKHAHALVCVPRATAGVEIGHEEHKLGLRASSTVTVRFEDVVLPRHCALDTGGAGISQAHEVLVWGRTLMAAGCVGSARRALAATRAHVAARRQFNRPLQRFQAVRSQVATMAAELHAMEAMVAWAAETADRGTTQPSPSLMAKVFCSEGALSICDRAMQLHGALGFMEDVGIARLWRDCRVARIFEGANDVLLVQLGALLLSEQHAAASREEGDGAPPGARVRECQDAVAQTAASLGRRHGVAIVHEQLALQGLARAHMATEAARRAEWLARRARGGIDPVGAYATQMLCRRAWGALREAREGAALWPLAAAAFDALADADANTTAHGGGAVDTNPVPRPSAEGAQP